MFNSYVHDKQAQTASARSHRELEGEKLREKEGKTRTELARRFKQRLDQELVKVTYMQIALNTSAPCRHKDTQATAKLLGEAKFRVQGCRTTLERLEDSAGDRALLDTSASHTPVFLLRPRQKDLEISSPLRFGANTQAERLTDATGTRFRYNPAGKSYTDLRAHSAGRALHSDTLQKTHYKTILSLGLNLHAWLQGKNYAGPREEALREQVRMEKLGKVAMEPRKCKPLLLKQQLDDSLSFIENLRNAPSSAQNLVLTHEQQMRLTDQIVRNKDLKGERHYNVTPLRSHIGSSPTTYHSSFMRMTSLSAERKQQKQRKIV